MEEFVQWERQESELFHLYAIPPTQPGRLIATTDSDATAKAYLLDLYGVPLDSWRVRHRSEDGQVVTVWLSEHSNAQTQAGEVKGTYFTAERVFVVQKTGARQEQKRKKGDKP
jgi:hypothetical protein